MLKEEELNEIYQYVAGLGFRHGAVSETKENYSKANFDPERGEFFFIKDNEKLYFSKGEGLENGDLVPILRQISLKEGAPEIARKIWANLDALTVVGESKELILPELILSSFKKVYEETLSIKRKFSFLKGEEPLEGSLFDIFGDDTGLEPDIRGASPRNLSQGSLRDNEEREPGDYQEDELKEHYHEYTHSTFLVDRGWYGGLFDAYYNVTADPYNVHGKTAKTTSARISSETRAKNYAVIFIVKIRP